MEMISVRARSIQPSMTLTISGKAKAMKADGIAVLDFSAGEPDFDTPEPIKQAAIKAIHDGFTKYCAPLLYWSLSGEQKYFDAASQLMDYKLGLNPLGISYVTALGTHQIHNPHDRESAYTKSLGWGPKPGITIFGPGVRSRWRKLETVPTLDNLPRERMFADDLGSISFTEFTIFETMAYDALYTVLCNGGKWDGSDPFNIPQK